jgi:DNA-binding transcriptional LysR family regulator
MRPGALKLPPANSLVAFEATARHLSFKEAAKELKVTPAALSRQIRILETDLGCRLFERLHRSIRLTAEGRRLQQAVANGLGSIAACAGELRVADHGNQVTVGSTFAVAMLWLLPRLAKFHLARPDIDLRYVVSDSFLDVGEADVDVLLRYGDGKWPGFVAHRLFDDELMAVCSPEYLRRRPPLKGPTDLFNERLIHLENGDPSWEDWETWFAKQGVNQAPLLRGQRINSYLIVLQAAVDGLGIALGWRRLIESHLRQGSLVPAIPATVRSSGAYYQLLRERRSANSDVDSLRRWIDEEARMAA